MRNLDERIKVARDLMNKRQEIDEALSLLFGGGNPSSKRVQKCSTCGEAGHRASTCPQNGTDETPPQEIPSDH